jgi:hypothetical protein
MEEFKIGWARSMYEKYDLLTEIFVSQLWREEKTSKIRG